MTYSDKKQKDKTMQLSELLKQKREKHQLQKMRKLIEAVQQHKDLNIDDLILDSDEDDDDEKTDAGVMRTTHKKKNRKDKNDTIV